MGGSKQASRLWKHYFDSIDGVLFCVDISDEARIGQVKEMLWRTNDPGLHGVPFLIMFNKSDKKEGKMEFEFLKQTLLLEQLEKIRPVRTQICSALDGSGIWEGLN